MKRRGPALNWFAGGSHLWANICQSLRRNDDFFAIDFGKSSEAEKWADGEAADQYKAKERRAIFACSM
jgi:hypothetical protein